MSEKPGLGRAGGLAALAAVAAAAVAAFFLFRSQDVAVVPTALSPSVDATAPETTPQETTEQPVAATEDTGDAVSDEAVTAAVPPSEDEPRLEAATPETEAVQPGTPTFDHVRIDADGRALVSGRAPGGTDIAIEVDGADLQSVSVDSSGHFAALFQLPQSDDAQVISLIARDGGGQEVRSEDNVIVAPRTAGQAVVDATGELLDLAPSQSAEGAAVATASPEGTASVAEPEAEASRIASAEVTGAAADTADAAAQPLTTQRSEVQTWDGPDGLPRTEVAPHSPSEQLAPSVLLAGRSGVELLQPANAIPERLFDQVVVDVISYSDDGSVALEGRAGANLDRADRVQVYLNNRPVQSARIAPDGRWRMRLPRVDPGVYTLRVDQVAPDGRVVARFETPFKREDPSELARLASVGGLDGLVSASVITVQPGYTLWGIATDRYGDGLEYVQIFEANRNQIRDPDLIYPGQVFELPDGSDDEADPEDATE